MADVTFKAALNAGAKMNVGETKLVTSIFKPQLERLLLDCGKCGGRDWRIVISPLKGEHDGAGVIQDITCGRCFQRTNVLDGTLPGIRSNPIKRIRNGQ